MTVNSFFGSKIGQDYDIVTAAASSERREVIQQVCLLQDVLLLN